MSGEAAKMSLEAPLSALSLIWALNNKTASGHASLPRGYSYARRLQFNTYRNRKTTTTWLISNNGTVYYVEAVLGSTYKNTLHL